ncbi:MAG: DUF167 domain-containing protein [Patescibacteria group bacterium]
MKQILVEVRPNSKQEKIEQITDGVYKIHVRAPARDNLANNAVIQSLAKYFHVAKGLIAIKAGKTSKTKVIIISD